MCYATKYIFFIQWMHCSHMWLNSVVLMCTQDEEEEHVPPVLGRKYTAPLNILNDLSKDERVCTLM